MTRWIPFSLLCFLAWGVAGYAVVAYALFPFGTTLNPELLASMAPNVTVIHVHAFAASLALLLGPTQFLPGLRARRLRLHRWMGRCYLAIGVGLGGVTGLLLAQHAFGGTVARAGFGMLAVLWLTSGALALAAVLRGDLAAHRRWMVRNFALTLAAVTLRLYSPAAFAMGVAFETSYQAIAWLCWVPNLAVAQWWLGRAARPVAQPVFS